MAPNLTWFDDLERNLKTLAAKLTPENRSTVFKIINAARTESGKQAQPEPSYPSLAVTSIKPKDVEKTFNLKWNKEKWVLRPQDRKPMTARLRDTLEDFALATKGSSETEAAVRSRIDVILYMTLADKKRKEHRAAGHRSSMEALTQYRSIEFQAETDIKLPWTYKGEKRLISGRADYTLWYGEPDSPESNLMVVEAKTEGADGLKQAITYMAMVHHARKKAGRADTIIWGIATNSWEWKFIRLNADSAIDYASYDLRNSDGEQNVIGMLHLIFDHAAGLSPSLSRGPSLARKRTLEEAAGLEVSPA
ncbi:hypothetical protein P170DRAFT_480001 [Aspergillus steynii IBT 23096]|uniref:Uncharacterized protein n=1 Tax=Aspergillus steynii IBT 23096 TaxID=1392250 RepID=A0A2I2FUD6_9EURO|nr:uncharacterized protein P170DRAFT_480001 [Aspergillus steynii IBT 23096]PLB44234.1 hypothetical protein P170DRAFT_480001 [Aspergillus steynii IBT 23096]